MVPIDRPGKIVCVGLNYRDHAEEQGVDLPQAPLFFAKYTTCLIGPGDPIVIPAAVEQCDYEAELGVVIGETVRNVSKENAFEAVAGYVVANDVSARDLQFADGQWTRGKSVDTFCPVGPLVPRSEVPDPHSLPIRAIVSGRDPPGLEHVEPDLRHRRDHQLRHADVDARGRRPDPHGNARRGGRLPRPEAPPATRRHGHDPDRRRR